MKEIQEPNKFTREYFVEQGRRGGQKVKELYGINHFKKLRKRVGKNKVDKTT